MPDSDSDTSDRSVYDEQLSSLESLPQEVLVSIWSRLDSPSSLSMTSYYLYTFGKDAFVRSRYFLTRYEKYEVLYKAIAHPKVFDKALFKLLMHGGAVLSRALAQAICVAFTNRDKSWGRHTWGTHIDLDTYAAIIGEVQELYGNSFSVRGSLDTEVFDRWVEGESMTSFDTIAELFSSYRFLPLPWEVVAGSKANYGKDLDYKLMQGIRKEPKLLPLAEKNGYSSLSSGFIDSLLRFVFTKPRATPQQVLVDLQELLKDDRFSVSKTLASQIIMSKFRAQPSESSTPYEALKSSQPLLGFDLVELVFEVVTSFIGKKFGQDVMEFVDILTSDFPTMPSPLNQYHQLLCIFVKAEKDLLSGSGLAPLQDESRLARIHAMVGKIEVTNSHIYAILFSNLIQTTLCVSYARRFVSGFHEQAFLHKLMEPAGILSRPYKGRILKELLQRSDQQRTGLGALLERTIVSKAIDIQKLPLGSEAEFKSILTYEWEGGRRYNNDTKTHVYLPPGCRELWKTTPVVAETPASVVPKFELLQSPQFLKDQEAPELHRKKMKVSDFEPDSFITIFEARDGSRGYRSTSDRTVIDWFGGLDDVIGRVYPGSIRNASVVLEYFGPQNLTAVPIMLDHAVVNSNPKVMAEYLNRGVPLTLFHWQMSARLGFHPHDYLLELVKNGTLFVRSGNRRDVDDENDSFLLRSRASLNAQERRDLAGNSTTQGSRRGFFSSPTLLRVLQTEESPNPVYLVVATCEPPPFANRARTDEEKKVSLRKWYEHLSAIGKLEKRKHEIRKVSSGSSKTDKTPFHLHLEKTILPTLKALLQ